MKNKIPFEIRISLIYIVIGAAWILFSDKLVYYVVRDPYRISVISIYKGWFYVLITGLLLYLLIRKEISKRNKLYSDLLEAKRKATESDRLKTAFLANLSHYIRTPMNSILGFTELLQSRNLDEDKRKRFLTLIHERSHHLLQTISNIIEISKIQEGLLTIEKKPFSVSDLVHKLMLVFEQELIKKENKVSLYSTLYLKDSEDIIESDHSKVYHILSNLLTNAISFTSQGEIELGVSKEDGFHVFYIKDTGTGISPEKQTRLFSNFMQNPAEMETVSQGTGLGLFLAANLANLLGGSLWLGYSNEKGSMFCLKIPSNM